MMTCETETQAHARLEQMKAEQNQRVRLYKQCRDAVVAWQEALADLHEQMEAAEADAFAATGEDSAALLTAEKKLEELSAQVERLTRRLERGRKKLTQAERRMANGWTSLRKTMIAQGGEDAWNEVRQEIEQEVSDAQAK